MPTQHPERQCDHSGVDPRYLSSDRFPWPHMTQKSESLQETKGTMSVLMLTNVDYRPVVYIPEFFDLTDLCTNRMDG